MKKLLGLFVVLSIGIQIQAQVNKIKKSTVANIKVEPYKIVSFEVAENGDTINKIDNLNRRQGNWLVINEARYGEDGTMDFGNYINNYKTGAWQQFALNGSLLAEEFFKQGAKHGEAKYYENGRLSCLGNYLALDSKKIYDTIFVEDPITGIEKPVRIKTEVGSVKHGLWTFYKPNGTVERVLEYQADEIVFEKETLTTLDSVYIQKVDKNLPHNSQKSPANVWDLNQKRKAARFTDFPENTQYVKPNVRQKSKN